jgi:hypothetical protein
MFFKVEPIVSYSITSLLKQNLILTKCVWAIVCLIFLKSNAISKKVFKTILNDIMGVDTCIFANNSWMKDKKMKMTLSFLLWLVLL